MNREVIDKKALTSTQKTKAVDNDNLIQLSKKVKEAAKNYEIHRDKYHEASHQHHQAEQTYLKLKRQLSKIMREYRIQQFDAGDSSTVHLAEGMSICLIYDEQSIPAKFTSVHRVIDRIKIKKALIKGEVVPGAYLEQQGLDILFKLKKQ